jgi:curli biogenesis system outer membrane secretion channel CsgG
MNHTRLLIVAAMAVAALALVAAATVAAPLQLAEAAKKNNGCRNAICVGVNGNQDSANDNDNSFDFAIGL